MSVSPGPAPRPGLGERLRRWWQRADDVRTGVRWASVATVLGGIVVAVVCLVLVLRGRVWAWVPLVVAAAVALRVVRGLRRAARGQSTETTSFVTAPGKTLVIGQAFSLLKQCIFTAPLLAH